MAEQQAPDFIAAMCGTWYEPQPLVFAPAEEANTVQSAVGDLRLALSAREESDCGAERLVVTLTNLRSGFTATGSLSLWYARIDWVSGSVWRKAAQARGAEAIVSGLLDREVVPVMACRAAGPQAVGAEVPAAGLLGSEVTPLTGRRVAEPRAQGADTAAGLLGSEVAEATATGPLSHEVSPLMSYTAVEPRAQGQGAAGSSLSRREAFVAVEVLPGMGLSRSFSDTHLEVANVRRIFDRVREDAEALVGSVDATVIDDLEGAVNRWLPQAMRKVVGKEWASIMGLLADNTTDMEGKAEQLAAAMRRAIFDPLADALAGVMGSVDALDSASAQLIELIAPRVMEEFVRTATERAGCHWPGHPCR